MCRVRGTHAVRGLAAHRPRQQPPGHRAPGPRRRRRRLGRDRVHRWQAARLSRRHLRGDDQLTPVRPAARAPSPLRRVRRRPAAARHHRASRPLRARQLLPGASAAAELLSVMRNAAQPFGVADPSRPNVSSTIWRTVCDLTNLVYYYESSYSPNLIWAKLDGLRLGKGAPPTRLDLVREPEYVGEVSDRFVPAEPFTFAMP